MKHLLDHGYEIVHRNWRAGRGELDIVARCAEIIVFVEVRARRGEAFGKSEETLTTHKLTKVRETAQYYLDEFGLNETESRIDVIAIELDARNRVTRLVHIEHAVG